MNRDLQTKDGLFNYVETELFQRMSKIIATTQTIEPFGVVFTMKDSSRWFDKPRATPVGGPGAQVAQIRRAMREVSKDTAARGVLFVDSTVYKMRGIKNNVLRFQLEHDDYGDHIWTALIEDGKVGDLSPPMLIADSPFKTDRLAIVKTRWMH